MSFGKLSTTILPANTDTVVYTVPNNCYYALITINVLNTDNNNAIINIAISATDVPTAMEYIEKTAVLPSNGGLLERSEQMCSPGERIVIRSDKANTVVRISGRVISNN